DPGRLQQMVGNLLTNAIKFTPKGGRVAVWLEVVDSRAEIVVSDTGKGIGADFLPHIFERFRQADSTSTRAHSGLGLGLAIVRDLVELHGGTVRAESRGEGQGTTFRVTLPLLSGALIRKVRTFARERGGQVPALALTGFASAEDRAQALTAGYQVHMSKPVDPAALVAAVAKLVATARPRLPAVCLAKEEPAAIR